MGDVLTSAAGALGTTSTAITSPIDDYGRPRPFSLDDSAGRANRLDGPAISFPGLFHGGDKVNAFQSLASSTCPCCSPSRTSGVLPVTIALTA